MMRSTHLLSAIFLALCLALMTHNAATAQEPPQPTEQHKILQNDVGTWDAVCQLWPAPDADPIPFKAVEKNRLLEGGTWLISDYTADIGSMKFEGHGIFGYDPKKEKYVGTWVDNMTPIISPMEGTYDAEKKSMTMTSKGYNPETGKTFEMKNVSRYIDKDTRIFEMYMPGEDGKKMWKSMEMKYTRRK